MLTTSATTEATLKSEIMLQINQHLMENGLISKDIYEAAITRIVSAHLEG